MNTKNKNTKNTKTAIVVQDKEYYLEEAIELLPKISKTKFVGSVSVDVVYKLKQKDAKEIIRGSVLFPHEFGTKKIIYVICDDADKNIAIQAGAAKAGNDDLINEIEESKKIDFDILICTPNLMNKILKLAKILGPKGLMPNPKNGTITNNLEETIKNFQKGRINYKSEQGQNAIKLKVGKLDMDSAKLKENILAALKSIITEIKKFKGSIIKKIMLSPTMGGRLRLNVSSIIDSIK
ncbi:MAG: hypothetical protein NZZ41_05955 [Candidatus Dojkabacteria bacterium]|nr:hypothetical protein [Candidatus Dojkabacteria bacterium]